MPESLTFQIHPEGEATSLDLFVRVLEDVRKLVIEVDYAVNRQRSGKRWAVTGLHSSAPAITIAPAIAGLDEPVRAIIAGIAEIAQGTDCPPQYFNEEVLRRLKKMRRHFEGPDRARRISVFADGDKRATIAGDIDRKVGKILESCYWSYGSLEGYLEAANFHGKPNFIIWERVSRTPVRCFLPNDQAEKDLVKSLLEKRVLVSGKIRYFSNGYPRSISEIRDIVDNTPDPTLPKAYFGCIPDAEAAKDPAKFLRKIRGYDDED